MHSLWLALIVAGLPEMERSLEPWVPSEPESKDPEPKWLSPKEIAAQEKRARKAARLAGQIGTV